jgi:hypothetical protein
MARIGKVYCSYEKKLREQNGSCELRTVSCEKKAAGFKLLAAGKSRASGFKLLATGKSKANLYISKT